MKTAEYAAFPPSTMLNPTPVVLISCADRMHPERRNLVTAAWAGTVNSEPPMVSVSLRKERYSHGLIADSGEFVVNLADERMCRAVDFCGVRSGRDLDKAETTGLRYRAAEGMSIAPAVEGAPVSLSCRVRQIIPLGSHDLFLGEVAGVSVRKDLLDERGGLHLERAHLIAYNHGLYQKLGEVMGFFGWSVAREEVLRKRMALLRREENANGDRRRKP
jgi:flavin reductase (DIM6/NTAB) family NADH-FMN oxidoreductase RutF